jgi:hypothetical protein
MVGIKKVYQYNNNNNMYKEYVEKRTTKDKNNEQ